MRYGGLKIPQRVHNALRPIVSPPRAVPRLSIHLRLVCEGDPFLLAFIDPLLIFILGTVARTNAES